MFRASVALDAKAIRWASEIPKKSASDDRHASIGSGPTEDEAARRASWGGTVRATRTASTTSGGFGNPVAALFR